MAATAAGGDAWRITGEDRIKHDSQFFTLKPVNGFISGDQARGFFLQSGLPTPVLGQIWGLADMNNDGKMDKKEFSIAMHLIKKKLQGYELPKALPTSLKADPAPVIGSIGTFGTTPQPAMVPMGVAVVGMGGPGMAPRMPVMTNGMPPTVMLPGFIGGPTAGTVPGPGGFPANMPSKPTPPVSLAMPHPSKLKYTQMFNTHDRNKQGTLTGVEARAILMQTGAPQQTLAQIWSLSDVDKDGKLNCDEFCIAMHLIDLVKMGMVLPAKLPAELVPSKPRSGSFGVPAPTVAPAAPIKDSFGDLLGSVGMPAPVQPTTNGEAKPEDMDTGPDHLWVILPDAIMVLLAEFMVDWGKHAFILKFNAIPADVYGEYKIKLALDMASSRQSQAFTDHSDLVSRRMGLTPLPLACLLFRILSKTVKLTAWTSIVILVVLYFCLITFKVLNSIILLGHSYSVIQAYHEQTKSDSANQDQASSANQEEASSTNQSKSSSPCSDSSFNNKMSSGDFQEPHQRRPYYGNSVRRNTSEIFSMNSFSELTMLPNNDAIEATSKLRRNIHSSDSDLSVQEMNMSHDKSGDESHDMIKTGLVHRRHGSHDSGLVRKKCASSQSLPETLGLIESVQTSRSCTRISESESCDGENKNDKIE